MDGSTCHVSKHSSIKLHFTSSLLGYNGSKHAYSTVSERCTCLTCNKVNLSFFVPLIFLSLALNRIAYDVLTATFALTLQFLELQISFSVIPHPLCDSDGALLVSLLSGNNIGYLYSLFNNDFSNLPPTWIT